MILLQHNEDGIESRITQLRRLVGISIRDPFVTRQVGLGATRPCPPRNDQCEVEMIWRWMHANIRYTGDVEGYDTFQTARRTMQFRGGDCDDGFILITALLMGNGFKVKGRITKNHAGGTWAHIYPLVGMPKMQPRMWLPFDWTLGFHAFGTNPPQASFLEFDGHQIVYSPETIRPGDHKGW